MAGGRLMSNGLSVWLSIQMLPPEKEILDRAVERAQKDDPKLTRNRFLRNFIATLDDPKR